MGILENLKRRFGMAKRFRHEKKVDMKKGTIDDEYKVEEIAERVAEEEIEEMIEEPPALGTQHHYFGGKKSKEDFLKSKGLHERPNSHMAIKAWEEYNAS